MRIIEFFVILKWWDFSNLISEFKWIILEFILKFNFFLEIHLEI